MTHKKAARHEEARLRALGADADTIDLILRNARENAQYRRLVDELEVHEQELKALTGDDDVTAQLSRAAYRDALKRLTGFVGGIGTYRCASGHIHKSNSDCELGKRDEWERTGSTTNLPLNVVAGRKVKRQT
jgi:hypothetical protein